MCATGHLSFAGRYLGSFHGGTGTLRQVHYSQCEHRDDRESQGGKATYTPVLLFIGLSPLDAGINSRHAREFLPANRDNHKAISAA